MNSMKSIYSSGRKYNFLTDIQSNVMFFVVLFFSLGMIVPASITQNIDLYFGEWHIIVRRCLACLVLDYRTPGNLDIKHVFTFLLS